MSDGDQKINFSPQSKIDKTALKAKEMDLQVGLLGKIFGSSENAPNNICGIVALILVIVGSVICIWPTRIEPTDYLSYMLPVLTSILGYLFGKNAK
jgi:hypothetical protein